MIRVLKQVRAAEFSSNPPPQSKWDYSQCEREKGEMCHLGGSSVNLRMRNPNSGDAGSLNYKTEHGETGGKETDLKL